MILVLNTGSSTVKFAVYGSGPTGVDERPRARGACGRTTTGQWMLTTSDGNGSVREEHVPLAGEDEAVDLIFDRMEAIAGPGFAAVGHRIVHGGPDLDAPVWITAAVRETLRDLVPLAPDHLPQAIHAIDAVARRAPGVPQAACFDTTFHRSMPPVARLFGLPRAYADAGVVRYGFHGLSYEYVAGELSRTGAPGSRAIIAHLGSGASLVALRDGKSIDTTMGLTPTGGVVMATRSGDLDPGVLLYLLRHHRLSVDELNTVVNTDGGLAGLSGLSGDMRALLDRETSDPHAAQAVDVFCYSIQKAIGALTAVLGGLDTLVFTAGIGEHSAGVRARIVAGLEYLGIRLDAATNASHRPVISAAGAPVTVRVIPTNEELMLARHVGRLLTSLVGATGGADR